MPVVNLAASSFSTTGSISASSNSLTVANASGFAVNDYLIVEIGGEAGAGLRGTIGVGGAWPDLSYSNGTTMAADTSKPDGQFAYRVDTGNVYRSFGGVWEPQAGVFYYWEKVIPRSLAARITAKAGNVLTLDTAAVVTATNANVYFDNFPLFEAIAGGVDDTEVVWPTGNFALSDMCWVQSKFDWHIHGTSKTDTKLFFPKGISASALINFSGVSSGNQVSDICVQGNALSQGYMIAWQPPGTDQTTAVHHRGISFNSHTNGVITDTKSINVFTGGASLSYCVNTSVYRHDAVHTEGLLAYTQWMIQAADCTGGELVDCTVTCPKLTAGIEWFRSTGGIIRDYVGLNATIAMNTSNDWQIINPNITIEANSQISETSFSKANPVIQINTNIGGASTDLGGTLTNARITIEGYINADNDFPYGIVIGGDNPNVTISGGGYNAPDYASPSTLFGAHAIESSGVNTRVSCFTATGLVAAGTPTQLRSNIGIVNGSISHCRAWSIYPAPGVLMNGNGVPTDPLPLACIGTNREFVIHLV